MDKVKTNSLCLPFSRLSVIDTLGKGTFGKVQLVKEKTKGGVAALKTIPKESVSKFMFEIKKQNSNGNEETNNSNKMLGSQALKEITAMKRVCTGQCSGIPRYVGDREDNDNYYILMDSVKGKPLRVIINEMGPFTDINTIRSILAQIISTLSFIHSHHVLHRDLSDNNILVQPNGIVKIIDFGCATVFDPNVVPECSPFEEYPEVDPDNINRKNIIGTLDFIAPEVLVDNCYSEKSDIWSFGVLLFFMVTGHYPFSDVEIDDYYETMYNILENSVQIYDEDEFYEPLYDIFYRCCNPDVYSRITIEELKKHEFFEGIDWEVITLPKKKPNLSIHTSLLKTNANAALLANSNGMGSNQIYIASPTCLNSPIRINSPSCLNSPIRINSPSCLNSPMRINSPSCLNSPMRINSPSCVYPSLSSLSVSTPSLEKSVVMNSPLVNSSSPILSSNSPDLTSPLIRTPTPKIKDNTSISTNNNDYNNDTILISPIASKLVNINNYDKIINSSLSSSPNSSIINNITPKKPLVNVNKKILKDEYINSPLYQSTLFSSKDKSTIELDSKLNTSPSDNLKNDIDYNINEKKKNILFTDNDGYRNNIAESLLNNSDLNIEINNNESTFEHEVHSPFSPSTPSVDQNRENIYYSDDDTKSNCTLINESEKNITNQSLIQDNTMILNNVIETNVYKRNNSNIYKTWDSEHSHVITF